MANDDGLYFNFNLDDVLREIARRGPDPANTPLAEQIEHCIGWISSNCIIQDPTAPGGVLPFALYDYQREFIALWFGEIEKARRNAPAGIRTEKSRQMGDSWLMMGLELYTLRFWPHFRALNISRKQEKVDDGGQNSTPESLHGKVRFMYERLPAEEKLPLDIKHLCLVNPRSGATVIGEAASTNAGRGGTFLYGLWDETAATEHSTAISAAWGHAVLCPHYLSTPQGKSNFFAYSAGIETLVQVRHHWTMHPVKGEGKYRCDGETKHPGWNEVCAGGEWRSPWYDEQCKRFSPELIAQELDISYERSTVGRAFPEFDAFRHGVPDLAVEPGGVFVVSIDPGVVTAAAVLLQFVEVPGARECRVMDAWSGHDATVATYAELVSDWRARFGTLRVTGDPTGFSREHISGHSVFGVLGSRYGITVVRPPQGQTVPDRVRLVRDLMAERELGQNRVGRFFYRADLEDFARHLEEAKWPTDRDGRVTRETDLERNEAEHTADALYYGVACYLGGAVTALPPLFPATGWRPATAGLRNKVF